MWKAGINLLTNSPFLRATENDGKTPPRVRDNSLAFKAVGGIEAIDFLTDVNRFQPNVKPSPPTARRNLKTDLRMHKLEPIFISPTRNTNGDLEDSAEENGEKSCPFSSASCNFQGGTVRMREHLRTNICQHVELLRRQVDYERKKHHQELGIYKQQLLALEKENTRIITTINLQSTQINKLIAVCTQLRDYASAFNETSPDTCQPNPQDQPPKIVPFNDPVAEVGAVGGREPIQPERKNEVVAPSGRRFSIGTTALKEKRKSIQAPPNDDKLADPGLVVIPKCLKSPLVNESVIVKASAMNSLSLNTVGLYKISITIPDISLKLTDENSAFLTKPFYTSGKGYRLQLRIHPLGIYSAQTNSFGFPNSRYGALARSYMSVYAIICKGDHDKDLVWPFNKKINISMSQEYANYPAQTHKLVITAGPGLEQCVVRPTHRNTPFGFNKFISLEKMAGFTNTMLDSIKISVSLE